MACQIVYEQNLKTEIGYTLWEICFDVNGKRYSYELTDQKKWAVVKMAKYSPFKAFNYAKKHGKRITKGG